MNNSYANPYVVANAPEETRAAFIRRTYGHLAAAILAFAGLESILLQLLGPQIAQMLSGRWTWLLVMGAFLLVSWIAERWAQSDTSETMQYMGLGLYIVAEAFIFVPLMYMAELFAPGAIMAAGIVTLLMFAGLTAVVFITKKDFSFMKGILTIGGMIALGVIVASMIMGFSLGVLFSGIMVLFASGTILYSTSNVLHHYNERQHVAASLSLFASIALLFWYVLRIIIALSGRD